MPDKNREGPRKGSYMEEIGRTGPGAGHGRGGCKTEYTPKKEEEQYK